MLFQKAYLLIVWDTQFSDATSGWAGWALAHPEFERLVNPITTRGADYAHHITASPPGFENPAASLHMKATFKLRALESEYKSMFHVCFKLT